MNTKEFIDSVLPKFKGTREELLEGINKLTEETHEQWVKDIKCMEAQERLARRFQA